MRVTMVNKYYPPHLGGIEYHLRDLSEALVRRGVGVRAIVANEADDDVREDVNGVDVHRLSRIFAYASTPIALAMPMAIRAEAQRPDRADVLHLHFPYPWGETSWLRAKSGLPTVVTYHSDIVRQRLMLAAYRPLLRSFLDKVDLVIASSPNMVEHSPFLAPIADKCRVVPYGIDVDRYAPNEATDARAAELRAGHDRPIILFVGRLIYYKGADVLVRAMADVDADLVVVGRGPLEGELRQIASSGGTLDRITFLPPLPDDELRAWYRACDVFCLPSVARSEAFGLVQLEAHASGRPTVSTTLTTSVPFVNQDGVTGLTVPPGDVTALARVLQTLVTDEELRRTLGEQAYERVRRDFTIGRMVDDTMRVYEEAMRGRA